MSLPASFWRGAAVGIAATSIGLALLAGFFLRSGLPVLVDAVLGGVAGAAVFFGALLLASGLRAVARRISSRVLLFFAAAAVFLLVLQMVFGLPDLLHYSLGATLVLAQAVLVGALFSKRWIHFALALAV
ncbi:MAG TPA: hypothetical protein VIG29_03175, partial [Vicinamibacteria bacterium]